MCRKTATKLIDIFPVSVLLFSINGNERASLPDASARESAISFEGELFYEMLLVT